MSMEILILIKLLAAHFLADFCFQSPSLVKKKREGNHRFHLLHACIHAMLAYVFLGDWKLWYVPLTIGVSHYVIDVWKSRREESLTDFIIDQLLHLSVLILLWLTITKQFVTGWDTIKEALNNQTIWIYITGFIFILKPTSIFISVATKKWGDDREAEDNHSLKNAGQWIGYLERILVLVFMCLSVYETIGFILAAKSIFRFGELKEASDLKKTEYIMIGTFLSFTITILDGLIIRCLVR